MKPRGEFLGAVPVLPARDLSEARRFYLEVLGFREAFGTGDYLGMTRDRVELHLWSCADRHLAENSGCRLSVRGIDALYRHCQERGVVHPDGTLGTRPWGAREFSVTDPSGNLLTFLETSQVETSQVETSQVETSQVETDRVEVERVETDRA